VFIGDSAKNLKAQSAGSSAGAESRFPWMTGGTSVIAERERMELSGEESLTFADEGARFRKSNSAVGERR
jgi:hypothetical protein